MKHIRSNLMTCLKNQNDTLLDLILGILIFGVLVEIVGLFAVPDRIRFSIGLWMGVICTIWRAVHMLMTLDRQLDYGEKDARNYAAKNYFIRYFVVMAVLIFSFRLGTVCAAGAFIGVFLMKPAAIFAPQVHKYIYIRIFNKGR